MKHILITGGLGQIGSDLADALVKKYGKQQVWVTDVREKPENYQYSYHYLDVMDKESIEKLIVELEIDTVFHLAAMLSATSEKKPLQAWNLNTQSLLYFLELAKEEKIKKIYWPSSIAVFGNDAPKNNTPQHTTLNPSSVYGISKVAGELWCQYYYATHKVDVRSLRYPGLISWKTEAGGGTTDYAVDIFHHAITHHSYTSFLSANTFLPMMYMEDAIEATLALMEAQADKVKIRTAYNLGGLSFSPQQLSIEIQKHIPDFTIEYKPDFRQKIADSWPNSIDDSEFRKDIGFTPKYDLEPMVSDMLEHLQTTVE